MSRRADLMLGLFVALAISFKQTAIFLLVPLGAGLVLLLRYQCHLPWQRLLRGSAISLLTFVFAWAVLNIGILVDVRGFLEYQRATAIVMRREAVWLVTAQQVLAMLAKNTQGVTAAGLLAWLLAPCIRRDARFLVLWLAAVVGCVAFVVTSGGGIKVPRYLLPYSELGFALGCLAVLSLAAKKGIRGIAGIVGVLVIAGMELAGSVEVVRQAMEMPISDRCVNAIRQMADPTRDRVLGAPANIRQLQCMQAAEDEYRRHERLARKYGVNLLERAREHRPENRRQPVEGSFYILPMPFALGGMEDLSPDAAARAVRPYWWPVQPEEWELDYWTKQGFTIAVVSNEAAMLACRAPAYRSLHQQIRARGRLMVQLPTRRSLFDEREIRIYRLPPRSEPPGHE